MSLCHDQWGDEGATATARHFRVSAGTMADDELSYESVLCVKPEVHVYRIPPVSSNRGHRAAEWKLDQPAWSGRMRITAKGNIAYIKLEDKTSGELFAQAPVEQYPGISVESVVDSSRYFVIRIQDGTGRHAFIGIGFADRGDSFDFNVALQDHFKWVKQEGEIAKQAQTGQDTGPKLDLGFKDGQTIKINIGNIKKKDTPTGAVKSRPTGSGLLPPPPGSKGGVTPPTLIQPPLLTPPPVLQSGQNSNTDLLFDLSAPAPINSGASGDLWGDFAAAPNSEKRMSQGSEWVQF